MKPLENISVQLTKQPSKSDEIHLDKLNLFLKGKSVRGDDLLRASLYLVAEVVRRMDTPYFQDERLKRWLERVHKLANKQNHLLQGTPGIDVNPDYVADNAKRLKFLKTLISLAPDRGDCCE